MTDSRQTLLDYLTLPNPKLNSYSRDGGSLTSNALYLEPQLRIWTDFTLEALKGGYGHILDEKLEPYWKPPVLRKDQRKIDNENSVNEVFSHWNVEIVSKALDNAHRIFHSPVYAGDVPAFDRIVFKRNTCIKVEIPKGQHESKGRREFWSDWASYQYDNGHEEDGHEEDEQEDVLPIEYVVLLMGDSKVDTKWQWKDPKLLKTNVDDWWSENWIRPFRQITTYCVYKKTRYGFIITPKELVPVRVSCKSQRGRPPTTSSSRADLEQEIIEAGAESSFGGESSKHIYTLKSCSIPWMNSGKEQITVNLSLFWLHMMAVRQQEVNKRSRYHHLNGWLKESEACYRHHISGRKQTSIPAGGKEIKLKEQGQERSRSEEDEPRTGGRRKTRRQTLQKKTGSLSFVSDRSTLAAPCRRSERIAKKTPFHSFRSDSTQPDSILHSFNFSQQGAIEWEDTDTDELQLGRN